MKKLKLDLNDLKVESFETGSVSNLYGTIHGNATGKFGCPPTNECESLGGTCGQTCPATCANVMTCTYSCQVNCTASCAGSCGAC